MAKIYHIVHCDRLRSIVDVGSLLCDSTVSERPHPGSVIGMSKIKERRLSLPIQSHPGLYVGNCVPFYFCPRSVMLYVIHKRNHPDLSFRGGQSQVVHLEADMNRVVDWADQNNRRWAFTTTNAGSKFFEDYASLEDLNKLDWTAIRSNDWQEHREKKQAEFLLEESFPRELVERIGVMSVATEMLVKGATAIASHRPPIAITPSWYY
ncbi:MAG: DUF4433 domain-containing protein [Actinomycetota bacterium]|nr:DUF4433 domain-containing protein [Actinomycetota bacterium]